MSVKNVCCLEEGERTEELARDGGGSGATIDFDDEITDHGASGITQARL